MRTTGSTPVEPKHQARTHLTETKIDGQQATTIPFNRKYHLTLPAGWHTLGLRQIPVTARSGSVDVRLLVEAGETYELTATKVGQDIVLQQKRR